MFYTDSDGNLRLEDHGWFEKMCPNCKGKGVISCGRVNPLYLNCHACNRSGKVLTKQGEMLLKFMTRHLNCTMTGLTVATTTEKENQVEITNADRSIA